MHFNYIFTPFLLKRSQSTVVVFLLFDFCIFSSIQVLLLVKQRRRLIELKKSAELELEEIKKNSPGVFLH